MVGFKLPWLVALAAVWGFFYPAQFSNKHLAQY